MKNPSLTSPQIPKGTHRRIDGRDFGFPEQVAKEYQRDLERMVRQLDTRLRVASRIAMSEEHFDRLAKEALDEVLLGAQGVARKFVIGVFSWVSRAWKTQMAPSRTEQAVATLKQLNVSRALLTKHLAEAKEAFVAKESHPSPKKSLNRAAFYARDQTGTAYSTASKKQSQWDGAIGYIWVRTTSASPRDEHLDRVDQFFNFGEVSDEPGVLPNCKCSMEPVFPGSRP